MSDVHMRCLSREEVSDIIVRSASKRFMNYDKFLDKVMENIAGRYFFSSDYTLEDHVESEIYKGKLIYNHDSNLIRRAQ